MSDFTVLPIQIYYWTLDTVLVAEYANLAAATIIVLLVVLFIMNSVAIYIEISIRKDIKGRFFLKNKEIVYDIKNLNLWYGENHALKDINFSVKKNEVTAIIGPSGCGKSTFIKI